MLGSTEKRTALVTGAAGVLGLAVTKALIDKGMKVVMTDIDQAKLDALAQQFGGSAVAVACNLSDSGDVARAYAHMVELAGDIDILVNNAGILSNNKTEATEPEEWRRVMDINVNGVF